MSIGLGNLSGAMIASIVTRKIINVTVVMISNGSYQGQTIGSVLTAKGGEVGCLSG